MLIALEVNFFFDSVRQAPLDHQKTCPMPLTRVDSGSATRPVVPLPEPRPGLLREGLPWQGDIEALSLWAGQSVPLARQPQPAAEIVAELVSGL